jgi:hypothetical protein
VEIYAKFAARPTHVCHDLVDPEPWQTSSVI